MTLLATLYPHFSAEDFDLEVAYETPKRLVITPEQAKEWGEQELNEGREPQKWVFSEHRSAKHLMFQWELECNEYGESEEWLLVIEDVPFWKP